MKRIGVIGSINRDTVFWEGGREERGLGGILYTTLGLGFLGRGELEVWLCSKIGEDVADEAMAALALCPNVVTEGVEIVPQDNFHCRIRYRDDGSKEERLTGEISPLAWNNIAPFVGHLDGWAVNFITGFELELATFSALRQECLGSILLDVHSLTLGRGQDGRRFFQQPADWASWIALADVVQMNEVEAGLLGDMATIDKEGLRDFAGALLKLGPEAAVLTLGSQGVLGVWREGEEEEENFVSAVEPEKAVDTTGCGDVFLAGLGAGLWGGKSFAESLVGATRAAGLNSQYRGVEGVAQLAWS